jgi:NAD(P)-dependent dehydrogenase (short-subunit alcohol dehydrogenase family)
VWRQVVEVNLTGPFLLCQAFGRRMLAAGSGSIVNIASVAGLSGSKRASPYVASKHGVLGLTKAAALEYSGRGLRINAVCPGATETAQTAPILAKPQAREAMLRRVPMGRFAAPDEIAAAVLWLASGEASFASGAAFVLDGAMSAG